MIGFLGRGQIQDAAVVREFEHLFSRLKALLGQVLDADGNLIAENPNLAVVPVGALTQYAGTTAPSGYLLCDGSQVSRVTYKSLFDVVGTTYGTGDGSTTFNLPDLRQRFPLGKAASGTGATLGATGGNIDHTHTGPSHTHTWSGSGTSGTNGGFSTSTSSNGGQSTSTDGSHSHSQGAHQHAISGIATVAAGSDYTLRAQATQVDILNDSGTSSAGSHSHTVSDHTHSVSVGDHAHSIALNGTTSSDGSGNTGSANPPFLSLNYIIFTGVAA